MQRGRYYEDFQVGDSYRHHWGRTLTQGECQLFATGTMNAVVTFFHHDPVACSRRAWGTPPSPRTRSWS